MNELEQAYQLLDEIKDITDPEIIKERAQNAFNLSNKCYEAAIILSKLNEDFDIRQDILLTTLNANDDQLIKERVTMEIGYLYYDYGMFKTSLDIFKSLKSGELKAKVKYRIMTLLTHFEDDSIEDYYQNNTDDNDKIDYVRMSFPYMIYKFKKSEFDKVKELFAKIGSMNPYIIKVILSDVNDDNDDIKEAYKVFKNNAILINESPYVVKYLEKLC